MVAKVVLACLFGKSHSLEHKYRRIRDPKIFSSSDDSKENLSLNNKVDM